MGSQPRRDRFDKLPFQQPLIVTDSFVEDAERIIGQIMSDLNLYAHCRRLGLDDYIMLKYGAQEISIRWSTVATTMQAILGAVYFDGGMIAVKQVMTAMGLIPF